VTQAKNKRRLASRAMQRAWEDRFILHFHVEYQFIIVLKLPLGSVVGAV
jgi:hypothetical protein